MVLRPTRRDGDLIQPTVFLILDLIAVEGSLLFSYWFLPKGMALWVGVEFLTDAANLEPWVGE